MRMWTDPADLRPRPQDIAGQFGRYVAITLADLPERMTIPQYSNVEQGFKQVPVVRQSGGGEVPVAPPASVLMQQMFPGPSAKKKGGGK